MNLWRLLRSKEYTRCGIGASMLKLFLALFPSNMHQPRVQLQQPLRVRDPAHPDLRLQSAVDHDDRRYHLAIGDAAQYTQSRERNVAISIKNSINSRPHPHHFLSVVAICLHRSCPVSGLVVLSFGAKLELLSLLSKTSSSKIRI